MKRATARILVGALLVVPLILLIAYSNQRAVFDEVAAPIPVETSASRDDARPKEKDAAPDTSRQKDTATAADRVDKQMPSGLPERMQELGLDSGSLATNRDQESSTQAAGEAERASETEPEVAATGAQPPEEHAAEAAGEGHAAGSDAEKNDSQEESAAGGGKEKKRARRYYRRSYSYKPPAGANGGGGTDGSDVGLGTSGSGGGSNLSLENLSGNQPPGQPSAAAPSAPENDAGAIVSMGAPDRAEESASEQPGPEASEVTSMPDASAPDIAPGAGAGAPAAAATGAAEEVKQDWSIVPVYYGTDRARSDKDDRVGYDWQRGRRLELGRALVTIPKEHEVPMVERPWAIKIPYVDIILYEAAEDPKKHFTMKELKALTKDEFLEFVKERLQKSSRFKDHALVFIHGYKTTFDNAVYRTAQIAYDLKFDGAPFLYSWPSGGTLQGYTYDRESAGQAETHLRQFLEIVRDDTGAKKVSIIAHSMGNQLLLRTLQDMKRSMPEGVQISQLILAAPDVDRDSFQNIVKSIDGIAEGITLYAAANDTALAFSRRVNGGVPRAGDVPESGPIVMQGIDTIDATATSMDSVGINHSGYAENNALLDDIGKLVSAGVRPPGVRLPKLESVETDNGTYWRYPASQ